MTTLAEKIEIAALAALGIQMQSVTRPVEATYCAGNAPKETPDAMKYYSYMLKGKEIDGVLTLEEGGSFPVSFDRKSFVPGLNKVLARSCTKHLYEIFLWIIYEKPVDGALHKGIIVTGPPGDGKSFASQLFLCYFLRVEKEKRVHVVYEDVFSNRVWVFRSDGICRHFTGPAHHDNCPELDNPSTVFLFDVNADIKPGSGSREPVGCKAWLAVFSSANNDALKATSRLGMLPLSFVTPDYEDMRAAQVAIGVEFGVAAQFNKFGGRLRWPFDFTSQGINYYVTKAVENLNLNKLSSLLLNNYTIGFGDTAPTALFSTVLDPERQLALNQCEANPLADKTAQAAKRMQLLVDLYRASNVIWMVSSDHIFDKILNKVGENRDCVLGILDNATKRTKFGGVAGDTFQETAPVLLSKGGEFEVRALAPHKQEMVCTAPVMKESVEPRPVIELPINDKDKINILTRSLTDKSALYNIRRGFKGLDSIALPSKAYRYTVKSMHSIDLETVARLNEHMKQHHQKPLDLVFVVPSYQFPIWQTEQQYKLLVTNVELQKGSEVVWSGSFENQVQMPLVAERARSNLASRMSVAIDDEGAIKIRWEYGEFELKKTVTEGFKNNEPINFTKDGQQFKLVASRNDELKYREQLCEGQQKRLLGVRQKVLGVPFSPFLHPRDALERLKMNGQTRTMSSLARRTVLATGGGWGLTLARRSFGVARRVLF